MSNLSNSAVLVRLQIRQFNNSRQDPRITDGVKALHKLSGKAGRWIKYKLPDEALEGVRKAASSTRTKHYDLTLQWEEGYGLLPIAARPKYEAAMSEAREEFNSAVEAFVESYPSWIDQARLMHGDTFNDSDYPTKQTIRNEFDMITLHYPMPQSSHFTSELRNLYGAKLEAQTRSKEQEIVEQTFHRLLDPVAKMAERLSSNDNVFRDSLVENIRDILRLAPTLNVTGNRNISNLIADCEAQFAKLDAETLRTNKVVRKQAHEAAQAVINKFGNLGGNRRFVA